MVISGVPATESFRVESLSDFSLGKVMSLFKEASPKDSFFVRVFGDLSCCTELLREAL